MTNEARILFIDDDADHLALLQSFVELRFGALVDIATTSQGAEQRLNEHCYDLVISDVNLQGELGTTICKRLLERDPAQPLLLLTNYDAWSSIVDEARRLGVPIFPKFAVSYEKPPDGYELTFEGLLHQLLTRRPCGADATTSKTDANALPASEKSILEPQKITKSRQEPFSLVSPCLAAARATARGR